MSSTSQRSRVLPGTPRALGFRMPAEWEPHAATWLTWPRREGVSYPDNYDAIVPVYAEFIRHLVAGEEVHINAWDETQAEEIRSVLKAHAVPAERVFVHLFPSYEPWCRDHGPVFVVRDVDGRRERAVVDWEYNAWGGKYPPFDLDNAIPQRIAQYRGLPLFKPGVVLEGGSIDVNGCGTLLTTESCLLHPNRNPLLNRDQIEQVLCDYLGVQHVIWLGDGIEGDDTDGHVDDFARFVDPQTVVTVVETDPADANYERLQENLRRLRAARDQDRQPLRIVELPMPRPVILRGQRLPASYANFYIANAAVVVPVFRDPADAQALEILQSLFPDRRVVGIDSVEVAWGLGSFHCLSQQEPA